MSIEAGPQLVHIGREFMDGSCAFKDILNHELRHVYANQDNLEASARALQQEMRQHYGEQVLYGERNALAEQLAKDVNQLWLPRLSKKLEEVKFLHRAIDTPAEYARNNVICNGEIPQILAWYARVAKHKP